MTCGIYVIKNSQTGKVYVGMSTHIEKRWSKHRKDLERQVHKNSHLQASWRKYGKESFVFEILEVCNRDHLGERERYLIAKLNARNPLYGYNWNEGGLGGQHTEASLMKISAANRGRKHSDDIKREISESSIKMWTSRIERGLTKKVRNVTTGKVYDTIARVQADGFNPTGVHRCLRGVLATHHGCEWEYING